MTKKASAAERAREVERKSRKTKREEKAEKVLGGPVKKRTISRSAETGKLISKAEAKRNPKTTVTETVSVANINFDKPIKIPKSSAAAADLWYAIREHRLEEQKRVDKIKEAESMLRQHLIDTIPKSDATGAVGKRVQVQIIQKEVLAVQDADALEKFARRKGNEDLMVLRPNQKAIADRVENGKAVPGVGWNKFADIKYKSL